jgi:tRNA threonylcarbamoyladenosine biosynthesis protein TsaE
MQQNKIILTTKKDTIAFASKLAKSLQQSNPSTPLVRGATLIALVGELGAGKTFFTKALGKALGVKETIKSPSFNLMKIYEIKNKQQKIKTLIHVDCYRLNNSEELVDIGFLDYFDQNNRLIVVEWADKVKGVLPNDAVWIKFEINKNNTRTVIVN